MAKKRISWGLRDGDWGIGGHGGILSYGFFLMNFYGSK
jgi:hypothetical protein